MTVDPVTLAAGAATLAAGVAGVVYIARPIVRAVRGLLDFLGDWKGEPARAGVPARPGVMERLDSLEQDLKAVKTQVHPNGGTSMRDVINRVEENTRAVTPVQIHVAPGTVATQSERT